MGASAESLPGQSWRATVNGNDGVLIQGHPYAARDLIISKCMHTAKRTHVLIGLIQIIQRPGK